MTSRIDIAAPATITVLSGSTLSSLATLPPGGITITDPANGTLTVQITAANSAAALSASGLGGATVSANANTLTLTGTAAQIGTALASLQLTEPAGAATDTLYLTATDPNALSAQTAIAVNIAPFTGPAFANPPAIVTLVPNALDPIGGLIAGDPEVTGLNQAGQGPQESLALTLSVASGLLFLPGFSSTAGIEATGLGTGSIILTFTADQLSNVNALLAGLEFAGLAAQSGLAYALRNVAGPLGATITSGNIILNIAGTAGSNGTIAAGNQVLILGAVSLASGATTTITATTGDIGGIAGAGALFIAPDAALNLPYNALGLGGTSLDFGTLTATTFTESGSLFIADNAVFGGPVLLGTSALIDFDGTFTGDNAAQVVNELALSLVTGAVVTGSGTLAAGNFSESARITGHGSIVANGGDTLLIAAGSIGGGAYLGVAAGGVMVLGPVAPLYGVFNPTPLTIDSSVRLSFSTGSAGPVTGGYGDALAQPGGVFVINGPEAFSGTIGGFLPGDRLIFPGLSNISLYNITATAFSVAGQDNQGNTQTYVIHASYPSGDSPYAGTDNAGDAEISLRASGNLVFLAGIASNLASFNATAGVAQPVQGLDLLMTTASTLSLTVTLAAGHGTLSDGTLGPAATLTIAAANEAALDSILAGLTYTGTGVADVLSITSGTGILNGLSAGIGIAVAAAGTVDSGSGIAPTEADAETFKTPNLQPFTQAQTPGELVVTGLTDFADALILNGISGTALRVDAGATAIFDAAANVAANANVTIGDGGGPGTLAVLTDRFSIGGNLTLAASPSAAASAADIAGALAIGGSLVIGAAATAMLDLSGSLAAATASIGSAGTLLAYTDATAAFGKMIDAGALFLLDQAAVTATGADISGSLVLGGTAMLDLNGSLTVDAGANLQIGPDATLSAATLAQTGGTIASSGTLALTSLITSAKISLSGGDIVANSISLGTAAKITGTGFIEAQSLTNSGTIAAAGGALVIGGNIANSGVLGIGAGASLDIVHALTGGAISFSGTNAELTINDAGLFTATVKNMVGHDVIDLIGVPPADVTYAGGSITVTDTAGLALGGFALTAASGQPAVTIVADGSGGALITLGDEMPCFARGTRLLTPTGYKPIEILKPGDPLITASGDRRAIRWIGRRTLDFCSAKASQPILMKADAFGPGLPLRPLRLSPLHAVFLSGVLVPALHLVNGATIVHEPAQAAGTYFHVELDRHDIVLADGLPCETYLDTGNRGALYHESGVRSPCRKQCARRITTGPKLAAIRRRLHDIALQTGFSLTYQPVLRAVTNDRTILPDIQRHHGRRVAHFQLPPDSHRLTLLSRCASPADTDPDSEDRRDLAICLHSARAGRRHIRLGSGWHERAASDQGVWMGAAAQLLLPPAAETLVLTMAAIIQTWRPPVDTAPSRP